MDKVYFGYKQGGVIHSGAWRTDTHTHKEIHTYKHWPAYQVRALFCTWTLSDIQGHSSSCLLSDSLHVAVLNSVRDGVSWGSCSRASGMGGGGGVLKQGESCNMLINKRQLCMMLTAGWSVPRHNPPLLLLTFQRPGAYPWRRAQSSLSRSGSVQGSGGGRPWQNLSYRPHKNTR